MTATVFLPRSPAFASRAKSGCVYTGTLRRCGQSCRFSPFDESLLAVASADLFGLAGSGSVELFRLPDEDASDGSSSSSSSSSSSRAGLGLGVNASVRPLERLGVLPHSAAVNDACWSEADPRTLVSGGSGGWLAVWRVEDRGSYGSLAARLHGHLRDISALHWSCVDKRLFVSGSWDGQLLLWDGLEARPLRAFRNKTNAFMNNSNSSNNKNNINDKSDSPRVFACVTSPHDAALLASTAEDGSLTVHDLRLASVSAEAKRIIACSNGPVLSVDWVKQRRERVFSASADGGVCLWDLRNKDVPLLQLKAHGLAVRRVAVDPFSDSRFATCSYDLTVKLWSFAEEGVAAGSLSSNACLQAVLSHHREFVQGLEWSVFKRGVLCSTAWDKGVSLWQTDAGVAPPQVPLRELKTELKTNSGF